VNLNRGYCYLTIYLDHIPALHGYLIFGALTLLQGHFSQCVLAFLLFDKNPRLYHQSDLHSHVFRGFIASADLEINQREWKATPKETQVIISVSRYFTTSRLQ
jgi:hypothetical protein